MINSCNRPILYAVHFSSIAPFDIILSRVWKIMNDRVGTLLENEEKTSEGQAGFRPNGSCVDHVYTLGETVQDRKNT
ncbi:unnamed protein product, partial [Sphacelaria rigidula]